MNLYLGEIAAITTALFWAITSVSFEDAGRKIGSINLNLIRLLLAMVFLSVFTAITRGLILPTDATARTWMWLSLSGLVGIFIGDLFLFEAFVRIGARISMLIYASVPPLSGILSYVFLGEAMTVMQIIGMTVTLFGIALVILKGDDKKNKLKLSHPLLGILFAFGGAVGQAGGYIIGKFGMADYNAFAATQIRVIASIIGFVILFTIMKQWRKFGAVLKKPKKLKSTVVGSIFGPFLGISLSLYAVQRINPGVASTLISITPVLLIPYEIFIKKQKIHLREIVGSIVAIVGLALMFIK
ncbi:MAG: DMT family transporter [Clostridiales bacterium]|nr:DMT family transporter [Clostridiales bacterium]